MRRLKKRHFPALISSLALVAYLVTLAIFGSSASYTSDSYLSKNLQPTQTSATMDINVVSVDPNDSTMELIVTPKLAGDLGQAISTGSYVEQPISFIFDAYSEQTRWAPNPGDIQSAMPMKLRLLGEVDRYPFDMYEAQLFASVQDRESAQTQAIPLFVNDLREELPGFSLQSKQVAFLSSQTNASSIENDRATGVANLEWTITRSSGVVLIVFLLAGLMLTGALVSVLITIAILRGKRPPSINSLGWLAAFLFALFSVRAQLPGAPPSGVLLDVVIFYPTVLILVLLIGVNVSAWIAREDWDMENPLVAVRGKFPEGTHEVK